VSVKEIFTFGYTYLKSRYPKWGILREGIAGFFCFLSLGMPQFIVAIFTDS